MSELFILERLGKGLRLGLFIPELLLSLSKTIIALIELLGEAPALGYLLFEITLKLVILRFIVIDDFTLVLKFSFLGLNLFAVGQIVCLQLINLFV